jgi:hypothetical protein
MTNEAPIGPVPVVVGVAGYRGGRGIPQHQQQYDRGERNDCADGYPLGLVHVRVRNYSTRRLISIGTVFGAQKPLAVTQ